MKPVVGMVVSNKMQKSVAVAVDRLFHHKMYNRYIGDRNVRDVKKIVPNVRDQMAFLVLFVAAALVVLLVVMVAITRRRGGAGAGGRGRGRGGGGRGRGRLQHSRDMTPSSDPDPESTPGTDSSRCRSTTGLSSPSSWSASPSTDGSVPPADPPVTAQRAPEYPMTQLHPVTGEYMRGAADHPTQPESSSIPRFPPPPPPPAILTDDYVKTQLANLIEEVSSLREYITTYYPRPSTAPGSSVLGPSAPGSSATGPSAPGSSAPGPSTAAPGPSSVGRLSFDHAAPLVPPPAVTTILDMMSPEQLRQIPDHVFDTLPAYMVEEYYRRAQQGVPPADDQTSSSH
ncbi:putative 30S ribosomal protein S17 [Iris pallida]|uniref:30S ribosomal protein S17 n=1 Tax=Iris pallida TaxID=29817 RepID=A0AAX6H086_IRIPA|nr:putative 30S ribosomal protein S17 [Iris pallida]